VLSGSSVIGRFACVIRASTFSCAMIAAGLPFTVWPACEIVSLPPVWSTSALVLTIQRIGPVDRRRMAASTAARLAALPVSTTSTPSAPTCTATFAPEPISM
jgi:hypothetical protein